MLCNGTHFSGACNERLHNVWKQEHGEEKLRRKVARQRNSSYETSQWKRFGSRPWVSIFFAFGKCEAALLLAMWKLTENGMPDICQDDIILEARPAPTPKCKVGAQSPSQKKVAFIHISPRKQSKEKLEPTKREFCINIGHRCRLRWTQKELPKVQVCKKWPTSAWQACV